ncbi:Calcium/calmodulin-dependent protein kinase type 1B [Porphyridium purpureum]|uniref:Calcium/calmodulin-dependent protein kinase type 1B n=1 Tax=Porphyridium purpureum TaxID=35688 RepID=A0A5J4YTK1_PORPP|nr:Calcium/calmodulin-dependent protein kinase type 1B [Porphyridium purpureum]|eukprot:POR4549..scf229_5
MGSEGAGKGGVMAQRFSQRLSSAVRGASERMGSLRGSQTDKNEIRQKQALTDKGITLVERLGVGGQGEVFKATMRLKGGEEAVAVKVIPKSMVRDEDSKSAVRLEISLLSEIEHPNVVKFYTAIEDSKYWYVVIELLNGGDLYDRIQKGAFSEMQIVKFAEYTFSILQHLHAMNIAHRDLKLENFMLHKDVETGEETVKLIDFGLAYKRKNNKKFVTDGHPGTLSYQAPEIVRQQAYIPEKVDVWCAGVMIYSAVEKAFPFYGENERQIERAILVNKPKCSSPSWRLAGPEFEAIVRLCLEKDQKKRPTATQALKKIRHITNQKVAASPRHNPQTVDLSNKDTRLRRMGRAMSSRFTSSGSQRNLTASGSSKFLSSGSSKNLAVA